LKSAVTAGRITQAQADAALALMKTNITARLNEKFTPQGRGLGLGFTDKNGDGKCDNCGASGPSFGAGRGPARGAGQMPNRSFGPREGWGR
jgi:hypothetical protein